VSALHYSLEMGYEGFQKVLQLVCCANLLAVGLSISIVNITSSEFNQN